MTDKLIYLTLTNTAYNKDKKDKDLDVPYCTYKHTYGSVTYLHL